MGSARLIRALHDNNPPTIEALCSPSRRIALTIFARGEDAKHSDERWMGGLRENRGREETIRSGFCQASCPASSPLANQGMRRGRWSIPTPHAIQRAPRARGRAGDPQPMAPLPHERSSPACPVRSSRPRAIERRQRSSLSRVDRIGRGALSPPLQRAQPRSNSKRERALGRIDDALPVARETNAHPLSDRLC